MAKPGNMPVGNMKGLGELWSRLLFLFMAIVVYRIGTHIPVPGFDPDAIANMFNQNQGNILGMFNMFSGGALERMSILALGVMPYISASIIMQLMTSVTPSLEQIKKNEGEAGRRKINQYTRYGTIILALVQGTAMSVGFASSGMAYEVTPLFYLTAITSLVTGAVFMMWLGEQITERGIGNGISMLIFAGIVAGIFPAVGQALEGANQGDINPVALIFVAIIAIAVIYFVVFMERGQRRITVNYPQRQQGRQAFQSQSSHLPLKVNNAGVIPAIFASSLLLFPSSMSQWFAGGNAPAWLQDLNLFIGYGTPLYTVLFAALIIFFCFFYTALMFDPKELASNLKRGGAFLPGIRPGEHTAKYIDGILTRLTMIGALYMTAVCLMPQFLQTWFNVPFYLGGTSLLIAVVVTMDFMAQVQSHLMSAQYESLMQKSNLRNNRR